MKTSRNIQVIALIVLGLAAGACTFYGKIGKGPRVIGEPQAPTSAPPQAPTSATPEVSK